MQFQTGDVVKLRSGGPEMTVSSTKDQDVWCVWFVGQEEAKMHSFKSGMLEKVQPVQF
jgi:uncharacterized protein YodC (DUF2158 family)